MTTNNHQLDAYERPPEAIRKVFKTYSKIDRSAIDSDPHIVDFKRGFSEEQHAMLTQTNIISKEQLKLLFIKFHNTSSSEALDTDIDVCSVPIYEVSNIPGLRVLPALFPPVTQRCLLSHLLHRDLSNTQHMTNLHAHYEVPYIVADSEHQSCQAVETEGRVESSSLFSYSPTSSVLFQPKEPLVHRPLTISQVLQKKLRWLTLGGQYDWTKKIYPSMPPPPFPLDIAELLGGIFPDMEAQAAIVNLYSPGDTLSIHRDVSESCDRGLVSVSLGCDGLFVIGLEDGQVGGENQSEPYQQQKRLMVIRLRSGDAIYMSKEARYAWHGVPKIFGNTCPDWLGDWPARQHPVSIHEGHHQRYDQWRGWMANKRINLNVRQMHDTR